MQIKRNPIPRSVRLLCYEIDGWTCVYCGSQGSSRPGKHYALSVDHIIPVSRGGTDSFSNLITACLFCNLKKANSLRFSERVVCVSSKRKRLLMRWHGISITVSGTAKILAGAMNRLRGSKHRSAKIPQKNGINVEQRREDKS
jgi:hypothetical protein